MNESILSYRTRGYAITGRLNATESTKKDDQTRYSSLFSVTVERLPRARDIREVYKTRILWSENYVAILDNCTITGTPEAFVPQK